MIAGRGIIVIYDNALDLDAVRPFLPTGGSAHVLITSNSHAWGAEAESIEVSVWPKDIGAKFLRRRVPKAKDRPEAEALSVALGGLPLAHEQAAAVCEVHSWPFAEYLRQFEAEPAEMLDDAEHASPDYYHRRTVTKTFRLAIQAAAGQKWPEARSLVIYSALLGEAPVPLFLFSKASGSFRENSAFVGKKLEQLIKRLLKFAVISRDQIPDERDRDFETDSVRLHPLVRIIAASIPLRAEREAMRATLISALAAVYPKETFTDQRDWRLVRRLDAHALALVAGTERIPADAGEPAVYLLNLLADYRHGALADFEGAQRLLDRAREIWRSWRDQEHPLVATTIHSMGWLRATQSQSKQAEPFFLKALAKRKSAIRRRLLAADDPYTAETIHRIGWNCIYRGRYRRAECFLKRACWIVEHGTQPERPGRIAPFGTLGWLYMSLGRDEEGLRCYAIDLDKSVKVYGADSGVLATAYNNMGLMNHYVGREKEARTGLGRALRLRRRTLGPRHQETAATHQAIGMLLTHQGRFGPAERSLRRAHEIETRIYPPEHRRSARTTASFAELRLCQGRLTEAEELAKSALAIREKVSAPADVGHSEWLLGRIFLHQGRRKEAEQSVRKAIAILEASVAEGHFWLRSARATLAEICSNTQP